MKNTAEKLKTEITEVEGVPLVRVHGEVDLHTVHELESALRVGAARAKSALIVDLGDISYLDSAGLGALLAAYRTLSAKDSALYVVAPLNRPGVCRVLEITRLDSLLRVRHSMDDVLKELKTTRAA